LWSTSRADVSCPFGETRELEGLCKAYRDKSVDSRDDAQVQQVDNVTNGDIRIKRGRSRIDAHDEQSEDAKEEIEHNHD